MAGNALWTAMLRCCVFRKLQTRHDHKQAAVDPPPGQYPAATHVLLDTQLVNHRLLTIMMSSHEFGYALRRIQRCGRWQLEPNDPPEGLAIETDIPFN